MRYIRSNFHPATSHCACLFEAGSADDVRRVNEKATRCPRFLTGAIRATCRSPRSHVKFLLLFPTCESLMYVSEKGQVTIPKRIRIAAGVLPGSEVAFSFEAGNIVIRKVSSGVKTDRRARVRAAAAKVRRSMKPEFRQMSADEIMAFLRSDGGRRGGK